MFKHLRTKLTVLYATLFAVALAVISLAVYDAIARNAERLVRDDLTASGTVFDNVWRIQNSRLQDDADVLGRDFGFRAAVATNDIPTVRSALENLRARVGVDLAFVVDLDGRVIGADASSAKLPPLHAVRAIQNDAGSGVFMLGGVPYQAVASPIMTPDLSGWVVFAMALGPEEMKRLEGLSAIDMQASVLHRSAAGDWLASGAGAAGRASGPVQDFVTRSLIQKANRVSRVADGQGGSIALVRPLKTLGRGQDVVLLLRYPLAEALQPYRSLLAAMLAIGAVAMAGLVAGSWALARNLTRPISALDNAARRLQRGESAEVDLAGGDEIARLGHTFNAMAGDIREREHRLEQARDLAQAANLAKSEFLSNMGHEVRTPLNGVVGVAGLLSATALDARQKQMVGLIEVSAARLQRLLSEVLDKSDAETGHLRLVDTDFNLAAAAQATAVQASEQARAKGLGFTLDIARDAETWVRADRSRLDQIVGNLLDNAVKFTDAGEVRLSVTRHADAFRFEVADTGCGFDPAEAQSVFTAFRQADNSTTRRHGGAGLGLSLARDLARLMGGELTGEGRPGEGATFTLVLPLRAAAAPSGFGGGGADTGADAGADAHEQPLRILVADDHPTNRAVVELILAGLDVDLVAVENGAEAVEAVQSGRFDLVLMDLQMPVMDGFTAIERIRAHERANGAQRMPILVLSANVLPEHLQRSHQVGADGHLGKPIIASELISAIQTALAGDAADDEDHVDCEALSA